MSKVLKLKREGWKKEIVSELEVGSLTNVRAEGQFLVLEHENGDVEFIPASEVKLALVYEENDDDGSE